MLVIFKVYMKWSGAIPLDIQYMRILLLDFQNCMCIMSLRQQEQQIREKENIAAV